MQVTINGVPFVPACASMSRMSIAFTAHNRAEVLKRVLEKHMKYLPSGALVGLTMDKCHLYAIVKELKHTQECLNGRL